MIKIIAEKKARIFGQGNYHFDYELEGSKGRQYFVGTGKDALGMKIIVVPSIVEPGTIKITLFNPTPYFANIEKGDELATLTILQKTGGD